MLLRPYQEAAVEAIRQSITSGNRRVLLVAPTGAGKTVVFCHIIKEAIKRGNKAMALVHRKELLDQASQKLDAYSVPHGVIMGNHPRHRPWLPVQVASVQTLARRAIPPTDLLVVDEAHHARADTYNRIIEACPAAIVVGVTATPWRTDNRGLGDLFQDVVIAATTKELTAAGFLVPVTGFAFDTPDLSGVRKTAGDYNEKDLGMLMGSSKLVGNVVGTWLSKGGNVRTILFAVNVEHSQRLVAEFRQRGVTAEHLDGTTPKAEREAILHRLDSGATTLVSNVGVLTEGWDSPKVECCILARPTLSTGLYLQMVGRIRRPASNKARAVIFDHAGCVFKHGLPDAERDYSLNGAAKKSKASQEVAEPVRQCQGCFALYDPELPNCPVCGYVNPRRIRAQIAEVDGVEISFEQLEQGVVTGASESQMRSDYRTWVGIANSKGYKPGWSSWQFKAKYGFWPRKEWKFDSPGDGNSSGDSAGTGRP